MLFPVSPSRKKKINPNWKAHWIGTAAGPDTAANTWLAYRKQISITHIPARAIAKIAADSKYWLYINGKMVVFEGGLKRGPNPNDTYYDAVNIAPYLKTGQNTIAVLLWYFGKQGFSHKSSGEAGLLFDCQSKDLSILSDKTWKCTQLKAYQTAGDPKPNYRLPESNIMYDARLETGDWQSPAYNGKAMGNADEKGKAGSSPWNKLVLRPIPLWKDYGLKEYVNLKTSSSATADTLIGQLPYNAQITPYLEVEASAGNKIIICTDNYLFNNGGEPNLRAEYITKAGKQQYESLGWLNGQKVYYIIPKGIKVIKLCYRETGYDTRIAGNFTSSDPFFNKLWQKSQRTLYITMRDGYMDCPDRERAQWTGDATNESGEAFYALSPSSHALAKKWLHELIGWQRPDSSLFAPMPAGNWNVELPDQVAASVGFYGLYNYYLHTGDKQTLAELYPGAKRYLDSWKINNNGTIVFRKVGWTWGDWGDNRDLLVLFNSWYYLAIKGMHQSAIALGKTDDAAKYEALMQTFKAAYNKQFWNGTAYRDPAYKDKTDDRAQALAVVAGLADADKYPAILKIFQTEEHASPYMEKYVFEAMFKMGDVDEALARHKKRFGPMVNNPNFTTLFEGWGIGKEGFGGGTVNHAWSGGGLTVLSQYLCGIAPANAGYKIIYIMPRPGSVRSASAQIASVAGTVSSAFANTPGTFTLTANVPAGSKGIVGIPNKGYKKIWLNGYLVWQRGNYLNIANAFTDGGDTHIKFKVEGGKWDFKAVR
ncbi:glycoside hydrolase [Mucilaginibacter terrigena]|uniref:Glycoside hydrolase n=1 Tax=Mucilaginibacter terrigena TaxID=2492395 RepID=A0A4Q5LPT5_9SPHI|nr:alpha-L-rhamnosidase C-terminal domain-containing protein [Mucilaginibacter terrigena]RYU91417.1 glycoside hydrolase [Mucilaginibacter terrigena]